MKVFWSWQSDHPGRISRHFVREALELAVQQLNESPEIQEAQREVTLDHDRKGVPGSPDLANTILAKIRASDVLVADVTPVGKTDGTPPKRLINSNVAIELGYALDSLGDRRLIMVMNEHYGSRDDLPFDLRHKAGPVMYRLSPDSEPEAISRAERQFAGVMKVALRDMLPLIAAATQAFVPTASITGDPSRYFNPTTPLVSRSSGGTFLSPRKPQEFRVPTTPLLYLRVSPTKSMYPLKRADAVDLIRQEPNRLETLYYQPTAASYEANEHGAIVFDANYEQGKILIGTQLFLNREIWAFNATFFDPHERKGIPTLAVERTLAVRLPRYLDFTRKKLGVEPPVRVEAGACGMKGYAIYMPANYIEGPILQDCVCWSGTLTSFDPAEVDAALLNIFETFFDAGGVRRPTGLYNFPGPTAGSIPQRQ